jgi:hypothetical protein
LAPTCSFTRTDNVSIVFYLNRTIENFASQLFCAAVSSAADGANITFLYAYNISKFSALSVTVACEGYAVQLIMAAVNYRDPWTEDYGVVSAYVVAAAPASAPSAFDISLYEAGNIEITLMGVIFFGAAILLSLLLPCMENGLLGNSTPTIKRFAASGEYRRQEKLRKQEYQRNKYQEKIAAKEAEKTARRDRRLKASEKPRHAWMDAQANSGGEPQTSVHRNGSHQAGVPVERSAGNSVQPYVAGPTELPAVGPYDGIVERSLVTPRAVGLDKPVVASSEVLPSSYLDDTFDVDTLNVPRNAPVEARGLFDDDFDVSGV